MKLPSEGLATYLSSATRVIVYLLLFFVPLFYLPFTIDILEINKQTLLLVFAFASALTWIGSMILQARFVFRRGWINVFPLVLLLTFFLSAWHSPAPFLSWVGGATQEYTSALTLLGLTVLFYVIVNTIYERATHRFVHAVLIFSALIVAGISLSQFFWGDHMFNTIGTHNAVGIYLSTITVFSLAIWTSHKPSDSLMYENSRGRLEQAGILLLSVLTFTYLLVIDYWMLWLVLEAGLAILFGFVLFRSKDFPSAGRFTLPVVLFVAALPFWLWLSSPFSISVPAEVTLNLRASTELAYRAFDQGFSIYGTGPGTYPFVYAKEHSPIVNQTEFFNTRFDRASSLWYTLLPTIGVLGFIAFLLFLLVFGIRGLTSILKSQGREQWLQASVAFVPWTMLILAASLYHFNMTLMAFLFFFTALMASQVLSDPKPARQNQTGVVRLVASLFFTVGTLGFLVGIFVVSQRYVAEVAFAKAVRADRQGTPITEVVGWLDRAATLNRFDDRAYRVLAQALVIQVNEQLQDVSSSAELTPESRTYVQGLVAAAVNASVRATELSSNNPANWVVRGTIYRELMPIVPNASTFAVSAFERLIELEPVNPANWNELGITYLAAAERERPLTVSENAQNAEQAKALVADYMKKAEEAFNKAIELKANYAPAHYQLSLAYERQGRLDDAIGKLESVARYNPQDVGVAFQLGQLYLRRDIKGDSERAKNAFEYAISLAPSYSNARWFLASIYEQQGDVKAAIEQIEKVLELNPGNQLVKTRLDRLLKGQTTQDFPAPLP